MAFLILYKRANIGVHIPFAGGRTPGQGLQSFWTPRHLDGTFGLTADFDFVNFGASIIFGLRRTDINGTFVNPDSVTTLRNMSQVWYSNFITDNSNTNLLRYKIGVGVHQIGHDQVFKSGGTVPLSVETTQPPTTFFSPYIKLEYVNQQSSERFGASVQYYHQWILGSAWLEAIPNCMRLELKAGAPVGRKSDYWEPTHFLTLNIPITFSL